MRSVSPNSFVKLKFYRTAIVSYIGYVTQEVAVTGRKPLVITLAEDNKTLDEVVVIGYGTQRKGDVTSSVASVKAEDFVKGAVKDVGQLIQGKVAGLAITNPNGDPSGGTQIRLRGTNTIGGANTAPLVLIDGIPGQLSTVAPEDVESVDVLKDGSAAAIYGTRGTNGVILITTRQAKGSEINQVEYNGYLSTSAIAKKLEVLTADQFRSLYPEQDHGANTDWVDEIRQILTTNYKKYVNVESYKKNEINLQKQIINFIEKNIPTILRIDYDKYHAHWIVAVGYELDDNNEISSFLTLDPGVGSPTICPWNGILSSDKLPRKTYGYTYHTTESVNVDITEMVIIQKK